MSAENDRFREDILVDFATSDVGTVEQRLAQFSCEHPEMASDLETLARDLNAMARTARPELEVVDDGAAKLALSRFARIEARLAVSLQAQERAPFAGFGVPEIKAAATALGVNRSFVIMLRDRVIAVEEFGAGLLSAIAKAIDTHVDGLREYLGMAVAQPNGQMMKSDGKPMASTKRTLEEAMDDAGLDDEQKRRLLSL